MASSIATAYIRLLPDATGIVDSVQKELNSSSMATASKSAGEKIASGLSSAASKVMPLSLGITAIGTAAVKTTMDFDSSMSNVQAISGATAAEMEQLRATAREMGAATSFSASEAGDAMGYMAMAGWKAQDMISGIPGILSLAEASGEGLATTSDIVTDALTAFGMSAGQAGELSNIMAAASSNANTNVSLMGETFKYVAPVAGSLGMSAEDVAVAVGLMANAGIKGSQAGTSLKTALTNLANPTDKMKAAMREFGISLTDDNGQVKSLSAVMDDLRTRLAEGSTATREQVLAMAMHSDHVNITMEDLWKLSDAERENAAVAALGADAIEGMSKAEFDAATARHLGIEATNAAALSDEQYEKLCHAVGEELFVTGKAQQVAAAATIFGKESMAGMLAIINAAPEDYEKLTNAVAASGETFVKTADGSVMPMSQALEQGLEIVEEYDGAAAGMAATMRDNLSGQLTILGSQLQELAISSMTTIMPTIRDVVSGIQGVVNWLNGLDEGHKNLIVKLGLVVAAAGPVLGTASSIIKGVEGVSKVLKGAGGLIGHLGEVPGAFQKVIYAGNNMADAITNTVGKAFQWFSSQSTAWGVEIGALGTAAIGAADAILLAYDVEKLTEAWSTYHDALLTHNKEAEQALSNYAKLYEEKGKEVADEWAAMVYQIDTSGMEMDEAQKAIAAKVESYWDDVPQNMWDGFKQGWDHYFGSGEGGGIIGLGKDAFTGLIDGIKGLLGIHSPSTVFKDIGGNVPAGFYQGFNDEWGKSVLNNVKSLIEQFPNLFSTLGTALGNKGKEAINSFGKAINDTWGTVSNTVSGIVQKVPQFFTNLPQSLSNVGQSVINKFSSGMSEAWSKGSQFLSKIGTSISSAFAKVPDAMKTIGGNITTGLSNGISKNSQYVSEGMKKISEFINNFASGLDKAKDSMITIGGNLMTGLRNGIVQKANEALGAVKQAASNVVNAVKGVFGVHSPSKVFEEIGEELMEGLVVGIDEKGDTVEKAVTSLARSSNDALSVGGEIFDALVNGVDNGTISLSESLEGAQKFVQQFTDAFKALNDQMGVIGHNLMVNLANGIAKGAQEAAKAMSSAISAVSAAASGYTSVSGSSSTKTTATSTKKTAAETVKSGTISGVLKSSTQKMIEETASAAASEVLKSGTISGTFISPTQQMINDRSATAALSKTVAVTEEMISKAETATGFVEDMITEEYKAIQTAAESMKPYESSVVRNPYKTETQQTDTAKSIADAVSDSLSKIKVVLDDGTLVGHMTPSINIALGTMTYNQRREVLA